MSPFPVASYTNRNDDREKSKRLRQFRKGEISVLTTYNMLNEGVDVPDVDILCYMRVTHARNIFLQQLGRGLRYKEGGRKLIVLDYVDDLRRIGAVKRLKTELYNNDEYEDLELGEKFQLSFSNATTEKFLDLVKADEIELDELEDDNYRIYLN
jgi:superfamily II DNA or RNA helicase